MVSVLVIQSWNIWQREELGLVFHVKAVAHQVQNSHRAEREEHLVARQPNHYVVSQRGVLYGSDPPTPPSCNNGEAFVPLTY